MGISQVGIGYGCNGDRECTVCNIHNYYLGLIGADEDFIPRIIRIRPVIGYHLGIVGIAIGKKTSNSQWISRIAEVYKMGPSRKSAGTHRYGQARIFIDHDIVGIAKGGIGVGCGKGLGWAAEAPEPGKIKYLHPVTICFRDNVGIVLIYFYVPPGTASTIAR